jgi:hypothetical protein
VADYTTTRWRAVSPTVPSALAEWFIADSYVMVCDPAQKWYWDVGPRTPEEKAQVISSEVLGPTTLAFMRDNKHYTPIRPFSVEVAGWPFAPVYVEFVEEER